jgi:hypothetical protein
LFYTGYPIFILEMNKNKRCYDSVPLCSYYNRRRGSLFCFLLLIQGCQFIPVSSNYCPESKLDHQSHSSHSRSPARAALVTVFRGICKRVINVSVQDVYTAARTDRVNHEAPSSRANTTNYKSHKKLKPKAVSRSGRFYPVHQPHLLMALVATNIKSKT